MNNSFIKILRFEFKLNFIHWAISLSTFIVLIAWMMIQNYIDGRPFVFGGSQIPLIILFSTFTTLHSYSESTSRQSMELYHLLPISRNSKFFSKQLITFIFFPSLLILLYILIAAFVTTIFGESQRSMFSPNIEPVKIAMLFIWSHSLATLFAIVFKKQKLLYTIVAYFIFQFSVVIIILLWKMISGEIPFKMVPFAFTSNITGKLPILNVTIAAILYIISYRLFFRRQL